MSITQAHHTGYTVADIDRSITFYRDVLGFELIMQQEKSGGYLGEIVGYPDARVKMAHMRPPHGDHILELFQYLSPESRPARHEPKDIGTAHVCYLVSDLDGLYRRLRESGIDGFHSPPVEVDTGVNKGGKALYLRDPDGLLVELFQRATPPAS